MQRFREGQERQSMLEERIEHLKRMIINEKKLIYRVSKHNDQMGNALDRAEAHIARLNEQSFKNCILID